MPQDRRYQDLAAEGELLASIMWEDAVRLADTFAPETPTDSEPLPEIDQLLLLERVAIELPVFEWDNPDAVMALFELKRKVRGQEYPHLREEARRQKQIRRNRPDLRISPANPEFAEQSRRLGIKTDG